MAYPQITEYQEAVQHPLQAFVDPELKQGTVAENNLGLPLVMSGGFALTYAVTTPRRKCAVRCFHREIPAIQQKYDAISKVLRSLANGFFVDFDFQQSGINVRQKVFPIVRMDWVEGDTLGVWLDKYFDNPRALEKARTDFVDIARLLAKKGIAHGDIQNGNVMVTKGAVRLIDYDGMFVPGMRQGNGSETGHKHFQHPDRRVASFGPDMDRFSFIALDLSLKAIIADKSLYPKFREGGETIVFKANDFADPPNSEIFNRLFGMPKLKDQAQNFAAICGAPIAAIPTLDEYLAGRKATPRLYPGLPGGRRAEFLRRAATGRRPGRTDRPHRRGHARIAQARQGPGQALRVHQLRLVAGQRREDLDLVRGPRQAQGAAIERLGRALGERHRPHGCAVRKQASALQAPQHHGAGRGTDPADRRGGSRVSAGQHRGDAGVRGPGSAAPEPQGREVAQPQAGVRRPARPSAAGGGVCRATGAAAAAASRSLDKGDRHARRPDDTGRAASGFLMRAE